MAALLGRIVLTVLNVVFGIIGILLIVLGCFANFGGDQLLKVLNPMLEELRNNGVQNATLQQGSFNIYTTFQETAVPIIIFGSIVFVIAFFGCFGAFCQKRILLIVYIILISLILAAQIVAIVVLAGGQETWRQWFIDKGNSYLESEYQGSNGTDAVSVVTNVVFMKYNCCTWGDYTKEQKKIRFNKANKFKKGKSKYYIPNKAQEANGPIEIPFTCCIQDQPFPMISPANLSCASAPNDGNAYVTNFTTTCFNRLEEAVLDYQLEAILSTVVIILVEIIILIMAIWVCQQADESKLGTLD